MMTEMLITVLLKAAADLEEVLPAARELGRDHVIPQRIAIELREIKDRLHDITRRIPSI